MLGKKEINLEIENLIIVVTKTSENITSCEGREVPAYGILRKSLKFCECTKDFLKLFAGDFSKMIFSFFVVGFVSVVEALCALVVVGKHVIDFPTFFFADFVAMQEMVQFERKHVFSFVLVGLVFVGVLVM